MATAQMAFEIELDNRQKRKAWGWGVFLNVETQKKFLKTVSNAELQSRNDAAVVMAANQSKELWTLREENQKLKEENEELKSEMEDRDLLNEDVRNQERMFAGATPQDMRDLFWD